MEPLDNAQGKEDGAALSSERAINPLTALWAEVSQLQEGTQEQVFFVPMSPLLAAVP
jgi:hypothetical protein